jgi:hypothetical protein
MGDGPNDALRVSFDRPFKLEFMSATGQVEGVLFSGKSLRL